MSDGTEVRQHVTTSVGSKTTGKGSWGFKQVGLPIMRHGDLYLVLNISGNPTTPTSPALHITNNPTTAQLVFGHERSLFLVLKKWKQATSREEINFAATSPAQISLKLGVWERKPRGREQRYEHTMRTLNQT